jgi:hypothetical protein
VHQNAKHILLCPTHPSTRPPSLPSLLTLINIPPTHPPTLYRPPLPSPPPHTHTLQVCHALGPVPAGPVALAGHPAATLYCPPHLPMSPPSVLPPSPRRFVTRSDLSRLGLSHLLGTPLLRAYMHGFFMDARLYSKAAAAAAPHAYEAWRAAKVAAKMEEERQGRISVARKLPKVRDSTCLCGACALVLQMSLSIFCLRGVCAAHHAPPVQRFRAPCSSLGSVPWHTYTHSTGLQPLDADRDEH